MPHKPDLPSGPAKPTPHVEPRERLECLERTDQAAADFAARLIIEEEITWSAAAADAFDRFGVRPEGAQVAQALRRRFALFSPQAHAETLHGKRQAALFVMTRASDFAGLSLSLIGHVLEGSATEQSAVELVATSLASGQSLDDKTVSLALLAAGFEPTVLDAPYPTAFERQALAGRRAGRTADRLVTLLVYAGDEPVLIRVPLRPMPLPKPVPPDPYQSEQEAAGSADSHALQALLDAASATDSALQCADAGEAQSTRSAVRDTETAAPGQAATPSECAPMRRP